MTRNVRQVTKSVNPKELAVWPLKPFMERLWEYLYEIYDTNVHPALGESPKWMTPRFNANRFRFASTPSTLGPHMRSSQASGFSATRTTTGFSRVDRKRSCSSPQRNSAPKTGIAARSFKSPPVNWRRRFSLSICRNRYCCSDYALGRLRH